MTYRARVLGARRRKAPGRSKRAIERRLLARMRRELLSRWKPLQLPEHVRALADREIARMMRPNYFFDLRPHGLRN